MEVQILSPTHQAQAVRHIQTVTAVVTFQQAPLLAETTGTSGIKLPDYYLTTIAY